MLDKKYVYIFLLMLLLTIYSATAVTFNNQTQWQYGNSSFRVTYTLAKDITLDNLTVYDTGIIINNTDNISFIPTSGNLNITLYNWTHSENDFDMFGQNQSVAVNIKINGQNTTFLLNRHQNQTSFNATDSRVYWEYSNDTTSPSDITNLQSYDKSLSYIRLNWTLPGDIDFNHVELYQNNSGTLSPITNLTSAFTSYTVTGLTGATAYHFQIRAVDNIFNLGNYSHVLVTTLETDSAGSEGGSTGGGGGSSGSGLIQQTAITGQRSEIKMLVDMKSAYQLRENIEIMATTYLNAIDSEGELLNVGNVYFTISKDNKLYAKLDMQNTDSGRYYAVYNNELEEGSYDLKFYSNLEPDIVQAQKQVKISRIGVALDLLQGFDTTKLIIGGIVVLILGISLVGLLRKR